MQTAKYRVLLSITGLFFLAFPLAGIAGIVCWTNNEGIRECGNSIPPEYAQQESRTLNERGITVEIKQRAKTKEELAEEARLQRIEEKRLAGEKRRRTEQAAKDRVLLSTYASEQDIINGRDRKLAAIEATIEINQGSINKLERKLAEHRKRAANTERSGKPVPDELIQDMATVQKQIDNKHSYIAERRKDQEALREKAAAELRRFRELRGSRQR